MVHAHMPEDSFQPQSFDTVSHPIGQLLEDEERCMTRVRRQLTEAALISLLIQIIHASDRTMAMRVYRGSCMLTFLPNVPLQNPTMEWFEEQLRLEEAGSGMTWLCAATPNSAQPSADFTAVYKISCFTNGFALCSRHLLRTSAGEERAREREREKERKKARKKERKKERKKRKIKKGRKGGRKEGRKERK